MMPANVHEEQQALSISIALFSMEEELLLSLRMNGSAVRDTAVEDSFAVPDLLQNEIRVRAY